MSKICQNCGYQAEDNMNFCPQCHEKLSASGKVGVSVKKTLSAIKSKMSKKVIIAAIAAVVIVIALVVIVAGKSYNLDDPKEVVQMLLDKKAKVAERVCPKFGEQLDKDMKDDNLYDSKIVDCVNLGNCAGVGLKCNNPKREKLSYICLYLQKADGSWRINDWEDAATYKKLQDRLREGAIKGKSNR